MSFDYYDNDKISLLRRASQLKLSKDRILSNRIIFMLKRPKPVIIQNQFDKHLDFQR